MRWKEQIPVAYAGGAGGAVVDADGDAGGAVADADGDAGGAVADVGGSAESAAGVYVAKYASALNGVAKSVGRLESV